MFEKFGWKQITKSKIIQHQYDTKKTKKRVKTPPPGFSVLLGQKKLPKGDPPVRTHTFILLTTNSKSTNLNIYNFLTKYHIVASASPYRFEEHVGLFRLPMKGIFDPCVL